MSKKILIIFLFIVNTVKSFSDQNDVEIVFLPIQNVKRELEIPLSFEVFDRKIDLLLKRNDKLLSSNFQVWRQTNKDFREEIQELNSPESCHYLIEDDNKSAAINFCEDRKMTGIIFLDNMALEIMPIENNASFYKNNNINNKQLEYLKIPHIIKKFSPPSNVTIIKLNEIKREIINSQLTMELALFFDEMAYKIFKPFFNDDEKKLRDMLLAYVNGIQAIYHHPSLGVKINIILIRLEIMRQQPRELPHYNGERGSLLDSFCRYSKIYNHINDSNPNHWDIGLYISGHDFFAIENGRKNNVTMGLATVGGICLEDYSCVIAEFGVRNTFGKPYPSAGFTSVYIAAHEIGHNLGMHHDSIGNSCSKNGYIMSPSRGTIEGETNWSECSREIGKNLFRNKLCLLDENNNNNNNNLILKPMKKWTAKKQCELFLRNNNAEVVNLQNSCQSLECKISNKIEYYHAGPALEGTKCSFNGDYECQGGECLAISSLDDDDWSNWREESCKSGCLQKSHGYRLRRRICENPLNTCQGYSFDVQLCNDVRLCKKKRKSIDEFATIKCGEFSKKLEILKREGIQALHEIERPWMACAIFCLRKDIKAYYTPRIELNDLGLDPYFPDGTWCHYNQENYDGKIIPDEVMKYFSLDLNGKPLFTKGAINSSDDDELSESAQKKSDIYF
ncbi:A disintegrin and metalloproteinase with thrombospondin motifs adt-2-like isoform X2 [Leptopilina boulardi]|uniref:A disintegrin and metalloproteinase with thrombospondin motifs adt-2-like isoform X2 n=1 Tax=Leptopilina boulardi TaxID=63433 RepID=UPI0021F5378C|nr:A disintegrin and metalloproteinase with thrombospondin motifs adt-2-like isoform X2 [Leptopilina boulardi]